VRLDIANLAVFLASEEAQYMTGQQIRVDAGAMIKWAGGLPSLVRSAVGSFASPWDLAGSHRPSRQWFVDWFPVGSVPRGKPEGSLHAGSNK